MTKKKLFAILLVIVVAAFVVYCIFAHCGAKKSGFAELDAWAEDVVDRKLSQLGYPVNQDIQLKEFYEWYLANDLEIVGLNNAGDPYSKESGLLSSHQFEREVLDYFAPIYGFDKDEVWGMVSQSGTDGNNHGIYFGANYLRNKTGKEPVMYVSDEAHYSNARLADLQNLELRFVKSDDMGRMIPEELEKVLDPTRPCLIVYAMGSTFKGAIDDQKALNAVLAKHPDMPVFRHVDAALFGGYLPFTKHKDMVNRKVLHFESIAISGHKFFGMDEPAGLFLTTRDVYDHQNKYDIAYLNEDMKMINCSRSAVNVLKFWWLMKHVGFDKWSEQANEMLEMTDYLKAEMDKIHWPNWKNDMSNTIFFKRPSPEVVKKYSLACNKDDRFGGDLSHIVVMQHVTKEKVNELIQDLQKK
ncbi:MAG: aminotransferase class V-fold PLP-dependent enzyme [Prevotella sp.]|nr:aminotransferase class V-fold PLP-dependent enzyme [Candidatus Equicola faecalis]